MQPCSTPCRPRDKAAVQLGRSRMELCAVEQPDDEAILHLMDVADGGGHKAPSWVPLYVCAHEVLGCAHGLKFVHVEELQLPVHALQFSVMLCQS